MPLELTITNEEKIHVKLNITTATGKPATVDGPPQWSVVSGNGTVVPDADGKGAFLVSTDEVDGIPTVYLVKADADLGVGVTDIQETVTLNTTNAQAASLGLTADAAVPK